MKKEKRYPIMLTPKHVQELATIIHSYAFDIDVPREVRVPMEKLRMDIWFQMEAHLKPKPRKRKA